MDFENGAVDQPFLGSVESLPAGVFVFVRPGRIIFIPEMFEFDGANDGSVCEWPNVLTAISQGPLEKLHECLAGRRDRIRRTDALSRLAAVIRIFDGLDH